ncbi:MAG TPA: OmpH family outer membrane protein [Pyrinomonadaceae bacterium]
MKTFRSIAVSLFFAALFTVSAFAQTPPPSQPAGAGRIVTINTAMFGDEKLGITRYVNAEKALDNEFKNEITALQADATRMQNLEKEITTLREQLSKPNSPIKPESVQTKIDEYQNLQVKAKRTEEDLKAKIQRRQATVLGPITQDIMKAIQDFTKQKGYGLVLDAAKLDQAGVILGWDEAKVDVTKEFVLFYNARPATTAVTTPTKP